MISETSRDEDGKFAAGNSAARGRRTPDRNFKKHLLDCVTPERVREVEQALFEKAKGGDVAAMRSWLDHCVGKPMQAVEVSGKDGGRLDMGAITAAIAEAVGNDAGVMARIAEAFRKMADADGDDGGGVEGAGAEA